MRYYVTNAIMKDGSKVNEKTTLKNHNKILKFKKFPLLSGKKIIKHNIEWFI